MVPLVTVRSPQYGLFLPVRLYIFSVWIMVCSSFSGSQMRHLIVRHCCQQIVRDNVDEHSRG